MWLGAVAVWTVLAAVSRRPLNCNTTSLPQYTAGPEYLLLYIDRSPEPIVVLSTSATVDANVSSFSSGGNVYSRYNGYTGESWKITIETQIIESYNERTTPPTISTQTYIVVSGYAGPDKIYSVHWLGAGVVAGACEIFGKVVVENAPIDLASIHNAPFDVLLQAPLALAIVSGNTLVTVLCPYVHDAAIGSISYTSATEDPFNETKNGAFNTSTTPMRVLLQSDTHNGIVSTRLAFVRIGPITKSFSGADYSPTMTAVQSPTMPFYPVITLDTELWTPSDGGVWCAGTGPGCLQPTKTPGNGPGTASYDIVYRHINLIPPFLRQSMTIGFNGTHAIVPIYAGSLGGKGLLGSTVCYARPRYNFTTAAITLTTDLKKCTTIVSDPNSTTGLYCAENTYPGGRVYHYATNTTVVTMATTCATRSVVSVVGLCGIASVCVEAGRIAIHSITSSGVVVTPWANWTHTPTKTVVSVNVVPDSLTHGACGEAGAGHWRAIVVYQTTGGGQHTVVIYNESGLAIQTLATGPALFLATVTYDLVRDALFQSVSEDIALGTYWADTIVPGTAASFDNAELSIVTTSCGSVGCTVTIDRTTGGNTGVISSAVTGVVLPFSHVPGMLCAHAYVHDTASPAISSFSVNPTEGDVLVYATPTKVYRCFIDALNTTIVECTVDAVVVDPPSHKQTLWTAGQLVVLDSGPAHRWLFNLASFVRSNASGVYGSCWASSSRVAPTATFTPKTLSIGGVFEYANQYVSHVPNTTRVVGLVFNVTVGNYGVVFATPTGYAVYNFVTRCYIGTSPRQPPTTTMLHLFFPSHVCVDPATLTTSDSSSLYVGTVTVEGCTAGDSVSGSGCAAIGLPVLKQTEEYFDPTTNTFCDGTTAPEVFTSGRPVPNGIGAITLDQQVIRTVVHTLSGDKLTCVSTNHWHSSGTPTDVFLAYTGTRPFWGVFDICVRRIRVSTSTVWRDPFQTYRRSTGTDNTAVASPVLRQRRYRDPGVYAFEYDSTVLWDAGNTNNNNVVVVPDPMWRGSGSNGIVYPYSAQTPPPPILCPRNTYLGVTRTTTGATAGTRSVSIVDAVRVAPVVSTAGTCLPVTVCSLGTTYELVAPGPVTDRVCAPTTECYYPYEYETAPATLSSDRVCAPTSASWGQSYSIRIGVTPTSDNVFRRMVTQCTDGYYLNTTANANAGPGEIIDSDPCAPCPAGTTAYNIYCGNGQPLTTPAAYNPAECTSFHTYHTATSCVPIESEYVCGSNQYYTPPTTGGGGHPSRYCHTCTRCVSTYAEVGCTRTSNTVCAANKALGDGPPAPGFQQCAPDTYRDDSSGSTVSPCLPCTRCPEDLILIHCTRVHDTVCADYGSRAYVVEVLFIIMIVYTSWIIVFRVASPILGAQRLKRIAKGERAADNTHMSVLDAM